ncbi:MAG: right-handed parallel beta-helix repeat-containing protein, partial [Porticoccaceae bacterium]
MKRTWKQIGSMLLAVCMVFTLLPTMAFAETGDVDSGVPLGASGEITAFAALDAKTVEPGTPEDELKLPDTLDATLTEGDDTATGSDATKETETTVAVSGWTSDPAYDGDDEGDYIFTPTLALPDGLTLAEGVSAPTITVTVEAKPAELPQARGAATPFGAGASSVNNATGLKTALESPTADTITVTASFTLTDAVEVKADHTLIIESGVILTLGDLSPGSATLTVPIDETLTVNGAGTLEVSNTTTSFGVVVMGSMIVSGGNLTVKNSGEYTIGIYANGPLSIENNSVLSVANAGRNTGIQGNVTITNSTATISNTNSNMTECKGISASPLTIDNSTVTMSNSINSAGIHSSGANITLKNNAHVIAAGQGDGIYFGANSGFLTVDSSILELQSGTGLDLNFPDEVSFTGSNSGTVKLAQGVVVGSANGKMKDQGIVLTKKNVTVGAAEAESS